MTDERRGRVLVVALPEAASDAVRYWAEEGVLPTFRRLLSAGASGRVRAGPPLSPSAHWATILTGRNAGAHGIFGARQRGPDGRFRSTDATSFRADPLWRILSDAGLSGSFANLPLTWPPQACRGFMLSGVGAPGNPRATSSSPKILEKLVRRVGAYRPKGASPEGRERSDYPELFGRSVAQRTDAFVFLLREFPCDLHFVCFDEAALAQRYFWADAESDDAANPYANAIQTAFRCLDQALERLVAAAGPETNVFVVSECGAGPLRHGVQLDTWLEREGFLKRRRRLSRSAANPARAAVGGMRDLMHRRLPDPLLRRFVEGLPGLDQWSRAVAAGCDIDWSGTRAFSGGAEGGLYINLQGREPRGLVHPGAEYEAICDRLVERLSALGDPASGEPAVSRVHRGQELFSGPMLDWAPDLLIEWSDAAYAPVDQPEDREEVFVRSWPEDVSWPLSGTRRGDGLLVAAGPAIHSGASLPDATLCDLLPTWLEALGASAPEGLEGRAVAGLLEPSPSD